VWVSALFLAAVPLSGAVRPNLDQGLAIQGYDPVAYFDGGTAVKGDPALSCANGGAVYRFSSAAHLAAFKKDPKKYEPAYGGWCAYAMSRGELVEVDPKSFKIVGGRLMLFFKSVFVDTRKRWNAQETELLPAADAAWARLNDMKLAPGAK
jgi:YHS domain-containing protein